MYGKAKSCCTHLVRNQWLSLLILLLIHSSFPQDKNIQRQDLNSIFVEILVFFEFLKNVENWFWFFEFQESFSSNAGSMESSATAGISENSMAGGLPQGTLYHLHVCLRTGRDLVARDSGGTSDPYVKFYWRNKQVYKSKTIDKELNPVWDESFILAIDDPFVPLELKVLKLHC